MKLTREQVSQLSDIELNRAMYDHYWVVNSGEPFDEFFNAFVGADKLDYLTDYNLTMPMAFDNNIAVLPCMTGRYIVTRYAGTEDVEAAHKNPLRAICEVLLMIAMEKQT